MDKSSFGSDMRPSLAGVSSSLSGLMGSTFSGGGQRPSGFSLSPSGGFSGNNRPPLGGLGLSSESYGRPAPRTPSFQYRGFSSFPGFGSPSTGTGQNVGTLSNNGATPYDAYFVQAAQEMSQKYGVNLSPALLKAMGHIESGGTFDNGLTRDDGFGDGLSVGIMQVKPNIWGDLIPGVNVNDPLGNIRLGAAIMAKSMADYGSWEAALTNVYFPVNDPNGTTQQDYVDQAREYMAMYSGVATPGMTGQNSGTTAGWKGGSASTWGPGQDAPPPGSGLWTVTGGTPYGLSQGFGMTDFAANSAYGQSAYKYAVEYGAQGHIGIDISTPVGTPTYAPVAGTVVTAGGTGYFRDYFGQGLGELKLRLDNGDEIIFGHMSTATVPVGTRVNAGQMIGTSGGENGPHIHLEVRVAGASTPSGYQAVDPRDYFGGTFTGVSGAPAGQGMGAPANPWAASFAKFGGYQYKTPTRGFLPGRSGVYGGSGSGRPALLI